VTDKPRRSAQPDEMEARAWLAAASQGPVPLALNHFKKRADAEAFVNDLYSLGAARITACNISYSDGPSLETSHSDSLHVALPKEAERRAAIIKLCNMHWQTRPQVPSSVTRANRLCRCGGTSHGQRAAQQCVGTDEARWCARFAGSR